MSSPRIPQKGRTGLHYPTPHLKCPRLRNTRKKRERGKGKDRKVSRDKKEKKGKGEL